MAAPTHAVMTIDPSTEALIRQYYVAEKRSQRDTAARLGRALCWLVPRLRALGIPIRSGPIAKRRFEVNEGYFACIDSHVKAYVLGFLYADGYVCDPNLSPSIKGGGSSKRLNLHLAEKDLSQVQFLKEQLGYTGLLRHGREGKKGASWGFAIPSNKLCDDLIRLGCGPRKSFIVTFPSPGQVSDVFISSFVCGLFDGDGCIHAHSSRGKTPLLKIDIVVSRALGTQLSKVVYEQFGWTGQLRPTKSNPDEQQVWRFVLNGNQRCLRFMEWMYQHAPFAMERKRQRYQAVRMLYDTNLRFIQTPEWIERKRQRFVSAMTGRVVSSETRARISETKRARNTAKRALCPSLV